MEQFYQLLREFNQNFLFKFPDLPSWYLQFVDPKPPIYWETTYNILKDVNKNKCIIEVGCGYGNITALLYFLGFQKIISFERSEKLAKITNDMIQQLFGKKPEIINQSYPQKLFIKPDILLQVNCVYKENATSKNEYIKQIKQTYHSNGTPDIFITEFIDSSFTECHQDYPNFLRMSESEIFEIFQGCNIKSFLTYEYPRNKTSKRIYVICK